ncbi:MAG: hypothetical protein WC551_01340 [Patescibacteria group bacterium]
MASIKVDVNQAAEFFSRFSRFGGTSSKLKRLLGDDHAMKYWMAAVHDMFPNENPPEDVLADFKERCAAQGIDFGKFKWLGSSSPPPIVRDSDPRSPIVALDASLGSLQRTISFMSGWIGDNQKVFECQVDIKSISLVPELKFKPWTLRWVQMKLREGSEDRQPIQAYDEDEELPACAVLSMVAQHPGVIRADGYYGIWIPGLSGQYGPHESSGPLQVYDSGYGLVFISVGSRVKDWLQTPHFMKPVL